MKSENGRERMQGEAAGLRAVILAGGKGTRLRPFTVSFPKPLVPLGDRPVIEVLIRRLMEYGISDVTLTLGHLAELVKAYFDHRKSLTEQLTLRFVDEEQPTGTAGSLSLVPGLDTTFLTMNGDLLTDLDFNALVRFHHEQGALLTIATHRRDIKVDLGVLEFDSHCRITNYVEKPTTTCHVSMGVYVYEPRVLQHIEPGKYLDFPQLVLKLIGAGEKVSAFVTDCLWLDIGRPDDYARAQEIFAAEQEGIELV
jgi:NDP-sugar pyrophosphorylase family protein